MSKHGNLPYWEKQFPELVAKLTEYQRELLDTQAPGDFIALTEGQVKNRLKLLDEAKTLESQGKGNQSKLYKKKLAQDQDLASHDLLIGAIGHVISWSPMLVTAIRAINASHSQLAPSPNWWIGGVGLALYAITLSQWSSRSVILKLAKKDEEEKGEKTPRKKIRKSIWVLRLINIMLVYAPTISFISTIIGICFIEAPGPGGLIASTGGLGLLALDLLILWMIGKD
jgi:hypothetical protein